tara:strand:+ start:180 stop:461 length:282 start_codon:yes stop_codon:yes gene_type:complete
MSGINPISGPAPAAPQSSPQQAQLEEAAQRFESLLLSQVLSSALPEDSSLMGKGPGSHVYRGWLETYLADHLAEAGGLGLQETIIRDFGGSSE